MTDEVKVIHGDLFDVLPTLKADYVDAVVCDPPYGIGFMGREWDRHGAAEFADWCAWWAAEALRVVKPGGHLVAFGATRTHHRLMQGVEDAGWTVRDCGVWLYRSGFPKSLDVSKAIDKRRDDRDDIVAVTSWLAEQAVRADVTRADVDEHMGTSDMGGWWLTNLRHRCQVPTWEQWNQLRSLIGFDDSMDAEVWRLNGRKGTPGEAWSEREVVGTATGGIVPDPDKGPRHTVGGHQRTFDVTAPATDDAARWDGWGTALKPAIEPWVLARKPLSEGTVAANVLRWGTGALNIDGCRAPMDDEDRATIDSMGGYGNAGDTTSGAATFLDTRGPSGAQAHKSGRWPANVVTDVDDPTMRHFRLSGGQVADYPKASTAEKPWTQQAQGSRIVCRDCGNRSYWVNANGCTKCGGDQDDLRSEPDEEGELHPTVKPLDLMRHLIRLVTPPGGTVLDPFAGTGTTGEAAIIEGMSAILIEREAAYLPLIERRLGKPIQPTLGDLT